MKLAGMHLSSAEVEPCALRMGGEALTEAARVYEELSDEEACQDPDDNQRESLYVCMLTQIVMFICGMNGILCY